VRAGTLAVLLVLCAACKPDGQKPAPDEKEAAAMTPATVVRVQTTIGEKRSLHTIVIAGDKARATNEIDVWRLFDTKANTVTYVDDAAKTIRTEKLDALLASRGRALAASLPPYYPRATVKATGARRAIRNLNAEQTLIEVGDYRRELWIAEHASIPRGLFAMMHASEAPSSPLAPMMRAADEVLTRTRGFPLIDRIELSGKPLIERTVLDVSRGSVSSAVLQLPAGYEDVTPKPPPAAAKKTAR
jgi:hypothetical protein